MDLLGPQKPEVRYLETEIILLRQRVADLERRFYGIGYRTTSATVTPPSPAGTYFKPNLAFEIVDGEDVDASTVQPFGLRNGSKTEFWVLAQGTVDVSHGSANAVTAGLQLWRNGTAIPGCECRATMAGSGGIAKLNSTAAVRLAPGDEVHIALANITDTTNLVVQRAKLWLTRVPGAIRP
jgi:hypothetical protein